MKLIVLALLCTVLCVSCMDERVKPYEPGYFAKHPLIGRSIKSAGAGIATCAATWCGLRSCDSSLPQKTILLLGICAATGMWLYDENKKPHLLDAMICNPLIAHSYLRGLQEQLSQRLNARLENNEDEVDLFDRLLAQFRLQDAIFLLGECDIRMPYRKGLLYYANRYGCPFDRSVHPARRAAFENKVLQEFKVVARSVQNRPIIYASVGSGGMFQDAVILTQFLAKNPQAKIDIHLVDLKYKPLVDYIKASGQSDIASFSITKEQAKNYAQSLDPWDSINFAQAILGEYTKHKQLLEWLSHHFPHATLQLFAHDTVQNYCGSLTPDQYPDIMCAADVQDDYKTAVPDFLILCEKALRVKAESKNVGLIKSDKDQPVLWTVLPTAPESNKTIHVAENDSFDRLSREAYIKEQVLA